MPFSNIDTTAVARALAKIADQPEDLADVFFERREKIELPADGQIPGLRVWREAGLAVRLVRQGRTWLAGRDSITPEAFDEALRRVARAAPLTPPRSPKLAGDHWAEAPTAPQLQELPSLLRRALKEHHLDLNPRLTLRRHRRWVMVVGPRLTSTPERESFYSLIAELPGGGRYGALLNSLGSTAAEQVARNLAQLSQARDSTPPSPWTGPCVLGSAAAAVFLHEAVAHALEADTLALGGHPEAAVGVAMGGPDLNILDDPASAPEGVRRKFDDEGFPVLRRWLLRDGKVEQPICDSSWARSSEVLAAGAGRRGDRHLPPFPRSSHLELTPGVLSQQELMSDADGGLYLSQASRGHLDPHSGQFHLHFPYGRRIHHQVAGDLVGPCVLKGHISDLLAGVKGIGRETRAAGAGWCAKGGIKLPVWATTPEIRLEGLQVLPA
jgi:predicted Zn-dependent protease